MTNFFDWELIDLRGKSSGQIKTKCPICIDRRTNKRDKSLSVNISKGVANCHYCGMTSARQEPEKVEYIPPRQDWKNYTTLSDGMVKYLESRKISQATAIEMRITEEKQYQPQAGKEVNNLVFNYFEGDKLVNKKYRSGAKHFTQTTGGKPIFYNINSIIGQKEAYIVEGEMDALTLHEIKVKNVISVPNGANDNDNYWINSERYISDVQKFYICTDNDTKGNDLAEKIAQRLGRWKCVRVNFQGKDANEDLQNGVLEQSIKNVSKYPISGTLLAEDLRDGMEGIYNNGLPSTVSPRHERWGPLKDIFSTMMGHLMVCTGIPSHGKALDVNTLIPTTIGFCKLIDLNVGDFVFDESGKPCRVVCKSEVWENRPTYKITFSDNSTIIADENHEWLTDTWESRRSEANARKNNRHIERDLKPNGSDQSHKRTFSSIKTTKEISETLKCKNDNRNSHSIRLAEPVDLPDAKLPIDPYVLGCWLGDGTSSGGGFTSADVEIVNLIRSKGHKVTNQKRQYGYGILGLRIQLRELNLLNNKHIPEIYLFSSIRQRFDLLRGLMDTDGHCSVVEARNEYCGTNKELVDGVFKLVCSLGIKATFVDADATLNGVVVSKKYRVFFKTKGKIFNLKRKQKVIDDYFSGGRGLRGNDVRYIVGCDPVNGYKTQCIQVDSPSHLFLAGEQFIPTHNSNMIEDYVLTLLSENDFKASFFSPEHMPHELHQTRFTSLATGKPYFRELEGVPRVTWGEVEKYIDWANEKIYTTSPENGKYATWDWVLEKFHEQIYAYGCNIFVVDAFNKVGFSKSGNRLEQIGDILSKLSSFSQLNNVLVILVAHPTKMKKNEQGIYGIPDLYDVSGSADFRNQAHDGCAVYRIFGDEQTPGSTMFVNLKTKYKFQGEMNGKVTYRYHYPSGRYYWENYRYRHYSILEDITTEPELKLIEEDEIPF